MVLKSMGQIKLLRKREKGARSKPRETPKLRGHLKEKLEKETEDRFIKWEEN